MILIDSAFETACRSFLQHKVKIKLGDNRKHRDTLISTMKSKLGEVDIAVWDNINFYIKPVLGYGDRISEQQMLAIARALMSTPRLLLLDEPSLGLAPTMVETVFRVIAEIRRQGVTVLMVEQNAALALRVADRAYVMESGRIALEGAARDLLDNADVRRAYWGASASGPQVIRTAVASTSDDLMSASARLASASA